MKKIIVVSAVNLVEGGTLTIFKNALTELNEHFAERYRIIALVHDKKLAYFPNIEYLEYPWVKKRWINRVYFEYFFCCSLSKKLNAYLWLAIHDMTPDVTATLRVVYCHNPTPFYHPKLSSIKYSYKEYLFSQFYKYLYRINIKKNDAVIVQQNWLKKAFMGLYNLEDKKIIVAKPFENPSPEVEISLRPDNNSITTFFYPSLPRTFKNFEIICEASKLLLQKGVNSFKVVLTIDGSENRYTRDILKVYGNIKQIKFAGLMSKEKVSEMYVKSSCLIFPSKLETWGLPISEFIPFNKPMIVADLPYAYETAMGAKQTAFFNTESAEDLMARMSEVIEGNLSHFKLVPKEAESDDVVYTWTNLFNKLLK